MAGGCARRHCEVGNRRFRRSSMRRNAFRGEMRGNCENTPTTLRVIRRPRLRRTPPTLPARAMHPGAHAGRRMARDPVKVLCTPAARARARLNRECDARPAPSLWSRLGAGLITGASDDDPSGIATYSQAGAQFGYQLAWTLLFTYPLMVVIQDINDPLCVQKQREVRKLLRSLETNAPPRNREEEAAKAKARGAARFSA